MRAYALTKEIITQKATADVFMSAVAFCLVISSWGRVGVARFAAAFGRLKATYRFPLY
jgi:hypothetical protein